VEDVDPDCILLYEHDRPGDIYFLSEGQVRLVRREEDGSDTSIVLTAGSILGARAAVLKAPQQYTAVTEQVCVFLKLGPAAIAQHFADHPEVKATLEVLFKRRGTPLATLLQCPDAHQVFETHLKEEYTSEHLSFYDDTIAFQRLMAELGGSATTRTDGKSAGGEAPAPAERMQAAVAKLVEIRQLYLGADAPSPLNIPDAQRQLFLVAYDVQNADSGDNAELERLQRLAMLVEEVKREVLALLERDNYSRFKVRWFEKKTF
jgi:CRP-like cAMP-binding protein